MSQDRVLEERPRRDRMVEYRLRQALSDAVNTVNAETVRPLTEPRRPSHSRTPWLVAASVLMITVLGGALHGSTQSPDAPETEAFMSNLQLAGVRATDQIAIFLCKDDDPFIRCRGQKAASEVEKQRIQHAVSRLAGVRSVHFEDQATAYLNFRKKNTGDSDLLRAVKPSDMPESFRVILEPGADRRAVPQAVEDLPGVSNIVDSTCPHDWREC
ncbi:cell division protein FtsX [Sphaerisporangium perillae]|uniref:cell division protein FtsX n=1 Tax=Sphaerisporangium perillae TaxID=2935860 RepID=UPI00200C6613|nr:permease-like cell division protein FtsX [Sphaerisporangium perillae]